jgi:hypothetical protein
MKEGVRSHSSAEVAPVSCRRSWVRVTKLEKVGGAIRETVSCAQTVQLSLSAVFLYQFSVLNLAVL